MDVPHEISEIRQRRGRRLYEARQGLMTQEELAAAANTTQQTISRIEQGQQDVSLKLGLAIAEALGVPYDTLWSTTEPTTEPVA